MKVKKYFAAKYDHKDVQKEMNALWRGSSVYQWDTTLPAEFDYVIDTPPPTVSGSLHIGHVYSYTQADILARYQRMRGKNVLYPIGWDDNGLPTERLVEKVRKIRGGAMAREDFVAICNEVIPTYEEQFRSLFTDLALSVDWSREYQTISDETRKLSQLSFLDLYKKGLVEKRLEPSLWDPADRTAIAQAEIEELEREGSLSEISFSIEGTEADEILIATTRPELLAGCGAIMLHPSDSRAVDLSNKRAISPLYGIPVPIIIDENVDPEKGTGAVMCCTFGDVTDIQWYRIHKLPLRLVIDNAGRMKGDLQIGNGEWQSVDLKTARKTMEDLKGLKVAVAREAILEKLRHIGALKKQEAFNQVIPIAERSGAPLEIIVTQQWFVKTLEFKSRILEIGRLVNWHPHHMYQRFESWVEGLKWDWCISRQRHFGVPIPVWISKREGEIGKTLLPDIDQLPINPLKDLPNGYIRDEVDAVADVMDTWATSSLTPQLTSRAIGNNCTDEAEHHSRLFPTSMRPQSHEIIRTWAFYTIVKSMHHNNELPWRDICISGWCLASDGSKMSKSKGNIIDPVKMLAEHGADSLRYWTGTSRLGHDTTMSPNSIKQGRRLATKIWNAARFAHGNLGEPIDYKLSVSESLASGDISHPIDMWVIKELATTISEATRCFEAYDYAHSLKVSEYFFWHVYCDNYLELVKWRVFEDSSASESERLSAQLTLYHVTIIVQQLFAPFLPYVTDKIFDIFVNVEGRARNSVHGMGNWPTIEMDTLTDDVSFGIPMQDTMSAVRKIKSDMGVSIKTPLPVVYLFPSSASEAPTEICDLQIVLHDLCKVLKVGEIKLSSADLPPETQSVTTGTITAYYDGGHIDD